VTGGAHEHPLTWATKDAQYLGRSFSGASEPVESLRLKLGCLAWTKHQADHAGVRVRTACAPKHLPDDAPNILIVLIDDAGPGLPSTFGW
jgi:hypothetical protein